MNCKQGDLALITRNSRVNRFAGHLVEVLYLAPMDDFTLPDGYPHDGQRCMLLPDQWVVQFKGSTVRAPCGGISRTTHYGCIPDRFLRPLRGDIEDIDEPVTVGADSSDQPSGDA